MSQVLALLKKYQVYEWVDEVSAGGKVIDTKWVVREKEEKAHSNPKRYKGLQLEDPHSGLVSITMTPMHQYVEKNHGDY